MEDVIPIVPGKITLLFFSVYDLFLSHIGRFLGYHHSIGEKHIEAAGVWNACAGESLILSQGGHIKVFVPLQGKTTPAKIVRLAWSLLSSRATSSTIWGRTKVSGWALFLAKYARKLHGDVG
jgi:hypothetical protein